LLTGLAFNRLISPIAFGKKDSPSPADPILPPDSEGAGERKKPFTFGMKNAYDSMKVERR
jgi:hypothetical protein